jgi:hypothetical protein
MAKKATTKNEQPQRPMSKWIGFSDVRLTDGDKAAIKAADWDDYKAALYLVGLAQEGYRCTLSWDEDNHCFVVSATGIDGNENVGLTMSQRHADFATAVCAHWYAHVEKTDRQWPLPNQQTVDW